MLQRKGTASGIANSVRALGFRFIGHDWHYLKIIREHYFFLIPTDLLITLLIIYFVVT